MLLDGEEVPRLPYEGEVAGRFSLCQVREGQALAQNPRTGGLRGVPRGNLSLGGHAVYQFQETATHLATRALVDNEPEERHQRGRL